MKLTEFQPFLDNCEKTLKIYAEWPGNGWETKRSIVAAGDDFGNCIILFKGNDDEVFAVKRFLEHLDERRGK